MTDDIDITEWAYAFDGDHVLLGRAASVPGGDPHRLSPVFERKEIPLPQRDGSVSWLVVTRPVMNNPDITAWPIKPHMHVIRGESLSREKQSAMEREIRNGLHEIEAQRADKAGLVIAGGIPKARAGRGEA